MNTISEGSPGDFFSKNKPTYLPQIVDNLRVDYMAYFIEWRAGSLSDWIKGKISDIWVKGDIIGPDTDILIHLARMDVEIVLKTDPSLWENWAVDVIWHYPGFEAITVQRLAHCLYNRGIQELPRALTESVHRRTGIDIHPGAQIGESFFIDHGTGVVIGETAVIGDNVVLYQGVTLGNSHVPNRAQEGHKRHPTLENGVTVCAGAMVLWGDTIIGSNSTIGGGTIITHSIPANSLAVRGKDGLLKIVRKISKL